MTILFVSTEFNYCCGVSRSVFSLAKELIKRGHAVILGTPGGTMMQDAIEAGVQFVYMPVFPQQKTIRDFYLVIRKIKSIARKYGVDVIHTQNRYAELLSLIANLFLRTRTVTTSHSMILGFRQISFRSDKVIAISHAVENMLMDYFKVKQDKINIVRNIPRPLQKPSQDKIASFRRSLGLSDDDYIIAGVGRLHAEKGFDILLKAGKNCRDIKIKFVLVGKGGEKDALKGYAEANGIKVIFVDEIDEVELIYSIADVLVIPSRREAASLVAIEAAFFARPVIATKVGGLVETIQDGKTGLLVNPESPREISAGINKLYHNRELASQLGNQLYAYVSKEYDAERITSQVEELYSSGTTN